MTILGKHTVAEAEELMLQKNSDILRLAGAFLGHEPTWLKKDPAGAKAFRNDLSDLLARWRKTRSEVNAVVDGTNKSLRDVMPAEDLYQDIIRTLTRNPGRFQTGDFPDLTERLGKQGVNWEAPVIQPSVTDRDLEVFKKADSTTKDIEKAGKTVSSGAFLIGSGVLVGILATVYLKRK